MKMAPQALGDGTARRCRPAGQSVVLLGEVCHYRVDFEVSEAQARPTGPGSLPDACGVDRS